MSRACPTIEDLRANTRTYFRRERESQEQRKREKNQANNNKTTAKRELQCTSVTRNNTGRNQPMTRAERINFLAFSGIIITIVGVYLVMTDPHFKNIFINAWKSTFGQLSMNSEIIILVLVILLVVVLFRKRS